MKLPVKWLKQYVDFEDTLEGLVDAITFSGVEVEDIGPHFDGVVAGEIVKVWPHPNADKLRLTLVNTGADEPVQVVCGAPNVREGMISAFAPIGAVLYNLKEGTEFKLSKAKLRGEESFGMLCSSRELNLIDDHGGIMDLEGVEPGTDLKDFFGPVLHLEVTPNRPDCLGMIGMAREVAALYGSELNLPAVDYAETGKPVTEWTSVTVDAPTECPRYTARMLESVTLKPSPAWMQTHLMLAGTRPINNVVDITNYVLLEAGQPLHAFDHSLLAEGRIHVRLAHENETMTTLDTVERKLDPTRLVICDAERPVALAGIMGGADSEIKDTTKTVLLESATFHPGSIRATSRQLKLFTESSNRFGKGADVNIADWASRRAVALLVEHADGVAATGVIDVHPTPPEPRTITCAFAKIESLIGMPIPADTIEDLLNRIELTTAERTAEAITVNIPTFRNDLERDVDLVEEVARLHGLDKIPAPTPKAEVVTGADDTPYYAERALREKLVGLGLQQAMNYSLTNAKLLDLLDPASANRRVVLPNPMSATRGILRTSLLPQLVESLGRNKSHQIDEAALFEIGEAFHTNSDGFSETRRLAIGLLGPVGRVAGGLSGAGALTEQEQFFALKGILDALGPITVAPIKDTIFDIAATVHLGDTLLGRMGIVAKTIRSEWRMNAPVAVAELDIAPLLEGFGAVIQPIPISEFPASRRDAALILDEAVSHQQILDVTNGLDLPELTAVDLFDLYRGDNLPAGKKSMAYRFTYRSLDRTLTDEDSTRFHNTVKDALRKTLGADVPEDS